jgi:hypothetical protein
MTKSKRNIKSRRNTKSRRINKKRRTNKNVKKGGCGCTEQKGGFGAASMQPIPMRYYYSGNSYENDPTNPSSLTAGRTYLATGGRKMRKMRGGVSADPILGAGNSNLSFGTMSGAFSGAATFHGNSVENPSITSSPVFNWKGSAYV